jgi:hypothetical protein
MVRTLCFWSPCHIGDVYISSFFINYVCKMNPSISFSYYTINGDIFFTGIDNLKIIDSDINRNYISDFSNGSAPENNSDNRWLNFLLDNVGHNTHIKELIVNDKEYTFLNTWCIAMGHDDFNFESAAVAWIKTFNVLNDNYGYSFNFNFDDVKDIINTNTVPRPYTKENVQEFFTENRDKYKKIVFCYNYVPRSVAFVPENMSKYLEFVSNNKETLLVLANHNDSLCMKENVFSCDNDFSIKNVQSCENLLDVWNVAKCCDEIITLPTGSSWTFFHDLLELRGKKLYLLGNRDYLEKLNKNIEIVSNEQDIPRFKTL